MNPLERAIASGDLPRAQSLLSAKTRAKKEKAARTRSRPPRAKGRTKGERDAAWREFVSWVRGVVWRLSSGRCEHCGRCLLSAEGEMDHSRGGAYRREFTRIDWCRRLCRRCHDLRHGNGLQSERHDPGHWTDHMEAVRQRRAGEHAPEMLGALRDAEIAMLAKVDPEWKAPTEPVRIEVRNG